MVRPMPITEDRIRELAYRLWLEDGQPRGKSGEHWKKARALLVREANTEEGDEPGFSGEPGEVARIPVSRGELPTMAAGQGERRSPKKRRPKVTRKPKQRLPM